MRGSQFRAAMVLANGSPWWGRLGRLLPASLVAAVFVVGACGHRRDDKAKGKSAVVEPKSPLAPLAEEACACSTLECIGRVQTRVQRMATSTHLGPESVKAQSLAHQRITECVTKLWREVGQQLRTLSDELCACSEQACYDLLRPKINVFVGEQGAAALPPPILAETTRAVMRLNECDARFAEAHSGEVNTTPRASNRIEQSTYSLECPSGWQSWSSKKGPYLTADAEYIRCKPPKGGGDCSAMKHLLSSDVASAGQLREQSIAEFLQVFAKAQGTADQWTELAKSPQILRQTTHFTANEERVTQANYFLFHERQGYSLQCPATEPHFDSLAEQFDAIARSIRFR